MALSEHEQKVLDELERGLYAEAATASSKLKSKLNAKPKRPQSRAARALGGALTAVVGLSVLLIGAIIHYMAIGVAGFALILFGVVMASSNSGSRPSAPGSPAAPKKPKTPKGSFFEDRWDKRINGE